MKFYFSTHYSPGVNNGKEHAEHTRRARSIYEGNRDDESVIERLMKRVIMGAMNRDKFRAIPIGQ